MYTPALRPLPQAGSPWAHLEGAGSAGANGSCLEILGVPRQSLQIKSHGSDPYLEARPFLSSDRNRVLVSCPQRGKCITGSSLQNSRQVEEFFNQLRIIPCPPQHRPPLETALYPHIKASHQLPRERINTLTERKQRECWVCGVNTCTADNPSTP